MKTFFTYILLFFSFSTFCQTNLVTNGSFEDIDSCYGGFAPLGSDIFQWSGCVGWSNPIFSSSDLWCSNGVVGNIQPPQIAGLGLYQYPKAGNNMAGIIINDGIVFNYREYIQNKLNQPLQNGYVYEVSFYISSTVTECSAVEFGVKFFSQQFYNGSKLWLTDLVPDAVNDYQKFIVDTMNWQKVTMLYKANGTENFMIIGNFEDSLKLKNSLPCDTTYWDGLHLGGGYYFIDDVEVITTPYSYVIPNVFTPNSDGFNDFFSPNVINITDWKCFIYNRWGQKLYELNNDVTGWDGKTTDGKDVPNGTYYYVFTASIENKKISEKGFITLLR